jgi:trans-aconitate methyltransferase
MIVRFQADADLDIAIVEATRRRVPDVDFQTAQAAGLRGRHDLEVLAIAAAQGRVLVTHDTRTMPQWFAEFVATATSAGVIMVPQNLPLAVALEELVLIRSARTADEWVNRICRIPL